MKSNKKNLYLLKGYFQKCALIWQAILIWTHILVFAEVDLVFT